MSELCFTVVIDPAAAAACVTAGVGAHVDVQLGHSIDHAALRRSHGFPPWGEPLHVPRDAGDEELAVLRRELEARLNGITRDADEATARTPVEPAPEAEGLPA